VSPGPAFRPGAAAFGQLNWTSFTGVVYLRLNLSRKTRPMSLIRRPLAGVAALAAVAALAFAAPAVARDAETDALATEIIHTMLSPMDMKGTILKGMDQEMGGMMFDGRPEWNGLMREAAVEEIDHDMPTIERMMGHAFAENSSAQELRDIIAFLKTSGGQALIVLMGDAAAGREMTQPSAKANKDIEKFSRTPAGRSFLSKMQRMEKLLEPVTNDIAAEVAPGLLRRFADKAEAAETARRAAAGR
jgi:hypothetical protein